ncbi:MAG: DUF6020 family protein [Lachnospiraceae bacterium]|nr:DUF6020 family protein [Butyrivibrio sp.]MCM1410808.1 DUF6020 family protein [Lachnospiraceae bacterium]
MNRRKMTVTTMLSLAFTVMQITGFRIALTYHTTVHRSALMQEIGRAMTGKYCLLAALLEFIAFEAAFCLLFTLLERTAVSNEKPRSRKWIGLAAALLFVCWLPCLLAGYPGYFNYDAFSQVPQALYEEVPYSAHHPLIHTLIMGKVIAFGYHHGTTLNDGIFLHSIFQMSVCALAFAYIIWYLSKNTAKGAFAAFCYYAFFPPIAMFAMSTTKDVLFSVCLQLTVIFVYEMCRDFPGFFASKWKICRFVFTALLMCMLRKNGVYAFLCLVPFVAWFYRDFRKKTVLLFVSITLLYALADNGLIRLLDAEKGSAEEMLSVPMQQIARVYHDYGEDAFTDRELELIYRGITREQLLEYDPFLSDHIKNYFDFQAILEDGSGYLSLWIKKAAQYPGAYLNAFLDNTYQAWYPGTSVYSETGEHTSYFEMVMWAGGERDSKAPRLLEFYRKIAEDFYYQKLPAVRLLFSIGAMFWVMLFVLAFAVYRKDRPLITTMLLALLYCLTLFLGPVSLVRYYLVLFYGFPVNVCYLFSSKSR